MGRRFFSNKYYLPIIITLVIAASWFGALDKYSDKYTDDSIIEAGTSYAIARGINGIVSILQTSTVQAGVGVSGSMEVGQILDPVNDLIERFSNVMFLALGSLALQKILLEISIHSIFKILIVVSGVALLSALLLGKNTVTAWASRIFFILIFVRFSLVFVVALNSVVDYAFISEKITVGTEELNEFKSDVARLKSSNSDSNNDLSVHEESIRNDNLIIDEINTTILPSIKVELENEMKQLEKAEEHLEKMQKRAGWIDRIKPFSRSRMVTQAKRRVSNHELKIEALQENIEEQENQVEQLHERIVFSEKRLSGEPVGAWETITNQLPSISGFRQSFSLSVIEENITAAVSNIIHLSVLFILKTILIPLAFFFLFIKGLKSIWKADLSSIPSNEKKLASE